MSTPRRPDSHGQVTPGWSARDLTPQDVTPLIDRFISKFTPGPDDECWLWQGRTFRATGYGVLSRGDSFGRNPHLLAHRIAWVAFSGKSLIGNITIDHLCNNRVCVNPSHLEPVSLRENIRRRNERLGYEVGSKATAADPITCKACGITLRKDGLRRHNRRKHGAA